MFGFLSKNEQNSEMKTNLLSWPYFPHFSASQRNARQTLLTESAHSLHAQQISDKVGTLVRQNQSGSGEPVGKPPEPSLSVLPTKS